MSDAYGITKLIRIYRAVDCMVYGAPEAVPDAVVPVRVGEMHNPESDILVCIEDQILKMLNVVDNPNPYPCCVSGACEGKTVTHVPPHNPEMPVMNEELFRNVIANSTWECGDPLHNQNIPIDITTPDLKVAEYLLNERNTAVMVFLSM